MLRIAAAALATLTAAIHIFVGGNDALAPMLAAGLPAPAEGAMHAVWHMVSAFLLWSALAFWRGGATAVHFAALWLISAVIFIYVGLWQDGLNGLVVNPQWTILTVTGALALAGEYFAWKKPQSQS
jgi:hypothetical protein